MNRNKMCLSSCIVFAFILAQSHIQTVCAQSSFSSPQIHCLAVDTTGAVTLSWTNPGGLTGFTSYNIYDSTAGTHWVEQPIITNINQTTVTIPTNSANKNRVYFIICDSTTTGNSLFYDTVSTILLNTMFIGGRAILNWNAIHTPLLASSSPWYKIYREYPQYVWTLLDSTQKLTYQDTITFCVPRLLNYKIEESDTSGCISVSDTDGAICWDELGPPGVFMDTVSVTPDNQSVLISWQKDRYNSVKGYVIFIVEPSGGSKPIDTVLGVNTTSYLYTGKNPDSASLQFDVAPIDSCNTANNISYSQNTLFLTQLPNACNQTDKLTWNSYRHLYPGVSGYNVFVSINGGPYNLLANTLSGDTSYTDTGLNVAEQRCYLVRVVDSASGDTTASSNSICDSVITPNLPASFYLNKATVINKSSAIEVQCYVHDTLPGIAYFALERANSPAGPFDSAIQTVSASIPINGFVTFFDTVNPNIRSYDYKVIGQNSCYRNVDTSNLGQTIFLMGGSQPNAEIDTLSWSGYQQWSQGVQEYLVYRSPDNVNFTLIGQTNPSQLSYSDNLINITTGNGIFYYYVQAVENPNSYGILDTSQSNTIECYINPVIYLPDAFIPGSKIAANEVFIPVGVFINATGYDFTIVDRWGDVVFDGNSPEQGWDGTYQGHKCPAGVYAYLLTYTSSKGQYFQKKGTVILIR